MTKQSFFSKDQIRTRCNTLEFPVYQFLESNPQNMYIYHEESRTSLKAWRTINTPKHGFGAATIPPGTMMRPTSSKKQVEFVAVTTCSKVLVPVPKNNSCYTYLIRNISIILSRKICTEVWIEPSNKYWYLD